MDPQGEGHLSTSYITQSVEVGITFRSPKISKKETKHPLGDLGFVPYASLSVTRNSKPSSSLTNYTLVPE